MTRLSIFFIAFLLLNQANGQNYTQTTHTPGYNAPVYIQERPNNPLEDVAGGDAISYRTRLLDQSIRLQQEEREQQAFEMAKKAQDQEKNRQAQIQKAQEQNLKNERIALENERIALENERVAQQREQREAIARQQIENQYQQSKINKFEDKLTKADFKSQEDLYTAIAPVYLEIVKCIGTNSLPPLATNDLVGMGKAVWDYARSRHPGASSIRESCITIVEEKCSK